MKYINYASSGGVLEFVVFLTDYKNCSKLID